MSIINIKWTCPNCKSTIDMDKPLPVVRDWEYDEIQEARKLYQEQYKLYLKEKPLLTDKITEFAILVNKHNKKFWCNKWIVYDYTDDVFIRIVNNTQWYKFGKSFKLIKSFSLENKKPYEFENVSYGIECPMCHKVDITKSETIDLSKE